MAGPGQAGADYGYAAPGATYDSQALFDEVIGLCRRVGARRVLDLGCGNGAFCRVLTDRGFEAVGCDPSESGVRIAARAVPAATFRQLGVYDDPAALDEPHFDAVVAIEVVEHLYLPRHLPRFARRVLKPGGSLILTTPYHGYLKNLAIGVLGRWDTHWSPLWDGGHVKFWSVRTLRALVEPEGFSYERFSGVGRVPGFWKSMVLQFRRDVGGVQEPARQADANRAAAGTPGADQTEESSNGAHDPAQGAGQRCAQTDQPAR